MRMKPQSEKAIETQILNVLKLKGFYFWKNQTTGIFDPTRKVFRKTKNPHAINGVSDILGCIQGRFVAIEVKSKNGKLSEAQKQFQAKINDEGGLAFTVNNLDSCLEILSEELDLDLV